MIALYCVDLLIANPQHLQLMVAEHRQNPIPTPTLKLIKTAGNAMPPHLVPDVRAKLCNDILCVYSSTESGPIAFGHVDRLEQPGTAGFLAPWVTAEIIGPDDRPVPHGVEGQLRVRTKWQGYNMLEGPDAATPGCIPATSAAYPGWHAHVGRTRRRRYQFGGYFYFARADGTRARGYPGLIDVAVVGMPQAGGQQEIWIGVMAEGQVNEQAIKDFLPKKNPRWKVSRVKVLDGSGAMTWARSCAPASGRSYWPVSTPETTKPGTGPGFEYPLRSKFTVNRSRTYSSSQTADGVACS